MAAYPANRTPEGMARRREGDKRRRSTPEVRVRIRAAHARWRSRPGNVEKVRDAYYRRKYGLSMQGVFNLLDRQGGRCAICQSLNPGSRNRGISELGRWHVDHDHVTNKVRGILCGDCNIGLGGFRDNPDYLVDAAIYLENSHRSL